MNVTVADPVVVAQTEKRSHPWGVWQFPNIVRIKEGMLVITYQKHVDSATLDTVKKIHSSGTCVSYDKGTTWEPITEEFNHIGLRGSCLLSNGDTIYVQGPPSEDIPKKSLPAPSGQCSNGYNGVYTVRNSVKMPKRPHYLMRRSAGKDVWERVSISIDDAGGGITCYDPPKKLHAVVHWKKFMQIVELQDNSLLALAYGYRLAQDRKPYPKFICWCLKSNDKGLTWKFNGIIAQNDKHPLSGFTEPCAVVLRDGSLLAVLRTECAKTGAMYRTRSLDGGKTWDAPRKLWPFGVLPRILVLDNGVIVLAFGRPGAHLLFSQDGEGKKWESFTPLVKESFRGTGMKGESYGYQKGEDPKGRPKQTRTSGYMGLIATGPNSFLVAYDQFDYPNKEGKPRKAILVRKVTVIPR